MLEEHDGFGQGMLTREQYWKCTTEALVGIPLEEVALIHPISSHNITNPITDWLVAQDHSLILTLPLPFISSTLSLTHDELVRYSGKVTILPGPLADFLRENDRPEEVWFISPWPFSRIKAEFEKLLRYLGYLTEEDKLYCSYNKHLKVLFGPDRLWIGENRYLIKLLDQVALVE